MTAVATSLVQSRIDYKANSLLRGISKSNLSNQLARFVLQRKRLNVKRFAFRTSLITSSYQFKLAALTFKALSSQHAATLTIYHHSYTRTFLNPLTLLQLYHLPCR